MRVRLSSLPDPPKEYMLDFPRLDGGLNLWDLDYRLDNNQSPEMKNLCWLSGALGCRDGQTWVSQTQLGAGYACCEDLFWGHAFFHIGSALYHGDVSTAMGDTPSLTLTALTPVVPQARGTFFRYGDSLYYKNPGGYFRIDYDPEGPIFSASAVEAYAPIILINADPATAAGDEYQPENRISPVKTVWYSTVAGVKLYHLPTQGVDSVDRVEVDGTVLTAGTGYTADLVSGTVTFATEPTHHEPARANTVKITYTKANPDALASIMDCPYAAVYGGNQNVCVVVGGCEKQPNAYFWSGSHTAMDPGYFPFGQYNFAGDTEEKITGFGKQQNMLVILKEHSTGRAEFGTVEMSSGRLLLEMPYTAINSRIGCDLPWTIRLVENNLVFCNTEQGVHLVRDSSAAYENNIVCISRNVNGSELRPGLLEAVRGSPAVGVDDDHRYWVVAGGEAYVWDYQLSSYTKPSWFYYTNIAGVAFFRHNEDLFHLDGLGRVTLFRRNFADYEAPIEKVYRFATQNLGGYDRLKDVLSVLFAVRSDTDTVVRLTYLTDYGSREDLTPIRSFSWRLAPRNLAYRFLGVRRFATVARRRPGCRHIRHFSMRLENRDLGSDLSVVSAQIFYQYQGRER